MIRTLRLLVFPVVIALGACDDESKGSSELLAQLERAEARWSSQGASTYTYVLNRHCSCPTPPPVVRVNVVNNAVVGATYVGDGSPVEASQLSQFRTLNGWFPIIRDALQRRVPQLQVEYEQNFGYPQSLVINYDITTASDDVFFTVAGYTPGPASP